MIYYKLFQLSGLRKTDINSKLGLRNNERQRYEKSKKIDLTTIKRFSQLLGVSENDVVELIVREIREMYKGNKR